jgi:hypothetical protein
VGRKLTVVFAVAVLGVLTGCRSQADSPPSTRTSPESGTWTNVTPKGVDLVNELDCGNFGTISMVADPARPSDLYTQFHCQGIWKSTDFGKTWTGPINTGPGGAGARGVSGLAIAKGAEGQPPILYSAGIRGSGMGFWKSTDGGVSWIYLRVAPGGDRQDFYPPIVDPYDANHLIMAGHEFNMIVESRDGGRTWSSVPMADGMLQGGGSGFLFFIDTGLAETTKKIWLWSAQGTDGSIGTWRTSDGGTLWTRVDGNEHPHGQMQIYQPDTSGVIYMAGIYSGLGHGVLRSTDFGQTWTHVGNYELASIVFGTPKNVYSMYSWACRECKIDPNLQIAPVPGESGWVRQPAPPNMAIGPAQTVTVFDGTRYVIVTANWLAGLWRYVE